MVRAKAKAIDEQLQDYQWLIGSDAVRLLERAAAWTAPTPSQIAALRRECSVSRAGLVVELAALRRKARAKFSGADRMFFTRLALEQATDEVVAGYKARRFEKGEVYDICCGVGGDLLALAARGSACGIDRDPVAALLASANLNAVQRDGRVVVREADALDVTDCDAWHIDPDRRPTGRRTTRVELHEPGPDTMDRLLAQNANAGIKLAPAAELPPHWLDHAALEWISRGRECRQLVAWFGNLADAPGRRATVLGSSSSEARTIAGQPQTEVPVAGRMGRYVFEPDAAVLAAKLQVVLAAEHGLESLAPAIAYWTGDRPIVDPALSTFEVLDVMSPRTRQLKPALRARKIGTLEIKKRGVDIDPAELRGQLELSGDESATLLIAPVAGRPLAILARRVT